MTENDERLQVGKEYLVVRETEEDVVLWNYSQLEVGGWGRWVGQGVWFKRCVGGWSEGVV